jgi:hypothetical protein
MTVSFHTLSNSLFTNNPTIVKQAINMHLIKTKVNVITTDSAEVKLSRGNNFHSSQSDDNSRKITWA